MSPYRLTRPYVGFTPATPHGVAGCRTRPPVSVPSAQITSPAATAAAEPALEPPGTRSRSHGLCVGKNPEFSPEDPMANSSQFVLPTSTDPAARSLAHGVQS